jgi:cob(I)alamin adenosyltransferase
MSTTPGYVLLDVRLWDIDEAIRRCDEAEKALFGIRSDVAISGRKKAKVKKDKLKCLKAKCLRYRNEINLLNIEIEKAIQQ